MCTKREVTLTETTVLKSNVMKNKYSLSDQNTFITIYGQDFSYR